MTLPAFSPTATVGPSFFQIPADKIKTCVNSCATSSAMISFVGLATQVARGTMGHLPRDVSLSIAVAPFLAARVIQHVIPETDGAAIGFGTAAGIGVTILIGSTPIGYMAGSVCGGLSAAAIAAARVRILREE